MKKLLFATALLTALFLSACGSQKADSNALANQPATRPEEGAELDPEFIFTAQYIMEIRYGVEMLFLQILVYPFQSHDSCMLSL